MQFIYINEFLLFCFLILYNVILKDNSQHILVYRKYEEKKLFYQALDFPNVLIKNNLN